MDQNGTVWESWNIGDYEDFIYIELYLPPGTYTVAFNRGYHIVYNLD